MGNKPSVITKDQDQGEPSASETNKPHEDEHTSEEIRNESKKHTVSLDKVGSEDLKKAGVRAEIAEKLAEASSKGRLKGVCDVVQVLENTGAPLQVTFDGTFKIEKDATGALSLQRQQQPPLKKKRKSFSFRRSFSRKKRKERRESDSDWLPDDDEEGGGEEGGEDKGGRKKLKHRKKHSSKSENDNTDDNEELADNEKLDINTATEDEFDDAVGIGPALAKKIIQYREQHGLFHELGDLVAIRGISKRSLSKLSSHLKVGELEDNSNKPCSDIKLNPVARDNSLQYGKRDVVRMISWNLQCFSNEKASNEGVIEVICKTILANG